MRQTMAIHVRRAEGAMIRTVGLIERRGFSVASITVRASSRGGEMLMHVGLETGQRSVSALALQVRKLTEVSAVAVSNEEEFAERLDVSATC